MRDISNCQCLQTNEIESVISVKSFDVPSLYLEPNIGNLCSSLFFIIRKPTESDPGVLHYQGYWRNFGAAKLLNITGVSQGQINRFFLVAVRFHVLPTNGSGEKAAGK